MNDYQYIPIENIYITGKNWFVHAELTRENKNLWNVRIPKFHKCLTFGKTKQEALQNIRNALKRNVRNMQIAQRFNDDYVSGLCSKA